MQAKPDHIPTHLIYGKLLAKNVSNISNNTWKILKEMQDLSNGKINQAHRQNRNQDSEIMTKKKLKLNENENTRRYDL